MKKHKLLLAVISGAMAIGMAFAAGCGGFSYSESVIDERYALLDLEVDSGAVKKVYNLGEEFSSERLFASAVLVDTETGEQIIDEDIASSLEIDSSNFNSSVVGFYDIYVSYTRAGVVRNKTYEVEVIGTDPVFGGISVEYPVGAVTEVTLTSGTYNTTIDASNLVVKRVNAQGEITDTLSSSDYDVELYKGQVKQESWTVGGGAYTIVVSLKSDSKISNFVRYFVIDDMQKIEFKEGTTQQYIGIDNMSSTWKFTVTYASGATKTVTSSEVEISGINAVLQGTRSATVVYTEGASRGGTITKRCNVDYTINASANTQITEYNFSYSLLSSTIGSTPADNTKLLKSHFAGDNAFIHLIADEADGCVFRTSNSCFQIKDDAFTVDFEGDVGTITISFASTGGSNVSRVGLKDAEGNYIAGETTNATLVSDADDEEAGSYSVTGTSAVTVTFTVLKSGTYTVCAPSGVTTRGARIMTVSMKDIKG